MALTPLQEASWKELLDEVARRSTVGCNVQVTYNDEFGQVTRLVRRDANGNRDDAVSRIQRPNDPPAPEDLGAPQPKDPPDEDDDGDEADPPPAPNNDDEAIEYKPAGCILIGGRLVPCFIPKENPK